jgi:hypothetical protein
MSVIKATLAVYSDIDLGYLGSTKLDYLLFVGSSIHLLFNRIYVKVKLVIDLNAECLYLLHFGLQEINRVKYFAPGEVVCRKQQSTQA